MNEETLIALTQAQAQELVNYLQTKPYGEVHHIIAMLMKCPAVKPAPIKEKTDEQKHPNHITEAGS